MPAFQVLLEKRSLTIAKDYFRKAARPEREMACLRCHSLDASAVLAGQRVAFEDGISCERCHGPAERWLATHYAPDWKRKSSADKEALGFWPTKDLRLACSTVRRLPRRLAGQRSRSRPDRGRPSATEFRAEFLPDRSCRRTGTCGGAGPSSRPGSAGLGHRPSGFGRGGVEAAGVSGRSGQSQALAGVRGVRLPSLPPATCAPPADRTDLARFRSAIGTMPCRGR